MGGMWAIYPCLPDLTNETDHNSCQIILALSQDTHYQGASAHEIRACTTGLGSTKPGDTHLFNHSSFSVA